MSLVQQTFSKCLRNKRVDVSLPESGDLIVHPAPVPSCDPECGRCLLAQEWRAWLGRPGAVKGVWAPRGGYGWQGWGDPSLRAPRVCGREALADLVCVVLNGSQEARGWRGLGVKEDGVPGESASDQQAFVGSPLLWAPSRVVRLREPRLCSLVAWRVGCPLRRTDVSGGGPG